MHTLFLHVRGLPMENNRAERLLKSVIIHRKRGQAFRSEHAMEEYGILLTVLNTWKERGLNIIQELHSQISKHIKIDRIIN